MSLKHFMTIVKSSSCKWDYYLLNSKALFKITQLHFYCVINSIGRLLKRQECQKEKTWMSINNLKKIKTMKSLLTKTTVKFAYLHQRQVTPTYIFM